ncbi:MAG: Bro-N domain-containing protein [Dialister sp.]|nr:Bro-N domain-containing protein [Dialister sp.]
MSHIQSFQNQDFGKLTVIEQDGEPYFIGLEVAKMPGYANPSKAIVMHVSEEGKKVRHDGTFPKWESVPVEDRTH